MPTLFGVSTSPADGGSQGTDGTGTPTYLEVLIVPPVDMVAGQLVVMHAIHRARTLADDTPKINEAGGQTWTTEAISDIGTAGTIRRFWCVFNGTWSADPSVDFDNFKGSAACSLIMGVWDPDTPGSVWYEDVAQSASIGTNSVTYTVAGITTLTDGALAISFNASSDNNNNVVLSSGSWTTAVAGLDNAFGTGCCATMMYHEQAAAGAIGQYLMREVASAPDPTGYSNQAWYAVYEGSGSIVTPNPAAVSAC